MPASELLGVQLRSTVAGFPADVEITRPLLCAASRSVTLTEVVWLISGLENCILRLNGVSHSAVAVLRFGIFCAIGGIFSPDTLKQKSWLSR